MSTKDQRPALTRAFREVTLSLIGLFELYDAEPELVEATADAFGRVFRAHLNRSGPRPSDEAKSALHGLLDEMDSLAAEAA